MGLFTFTMMMKTVRITKSLVKEIRTFCMPSGKHGPYQCPPETSRFFRKQLQTHASIKLVRFFVNVSKIRTLTTLGAFPIARAEATHSGK